jgi:hypothetical protein
MKGVCRGTGLGGADRDALAELPDDEVIEQVTAVHGSERWSGGRGDVCPAGVMRRGLHDVAIHHRLAGRRSDARAVAGGWA